ncbi:hypothetical protein [Pseudomonas sp. TCU-HL1]|uniref:hypothetical protein n=1 Tax=Pseudomonas sp. TCU-HL1 TaxID=1856685 RepID=UPI00083E4945|nr:hypothetical protein [Pseudomonas sp. TCU-HL1]AOE87507.1 hypothetical protein THL1_4959 [Pseudomonas sp. TCU-HL1]
MTDEANSHTTDTVGPLAQKPDCPTTRLQRTHALYHFLDKVDVIIKKRCALLERQTKDKGISDKLQRQELQEPTPYNQSITPRGDDELTDLGPAEVPKR